MRLKWVALKGFKAYKDETKLLLSPGANGIVGSNGSGKSSLLEAITLVVSEIHGKKAGDVKAYLHRGARNSVLSAYIELCFDNRDRTISTIDKDEVRFRRNFSLSGPKKDELLVDGKKVTKAEFVSLLESGGFSKSNPYYVIRQGKIMEMAEMTDEGRLKLLKDFSGVQIYEEKRRLAAESLRNSQDVASQAEDQMKDLASRLAELEEQEKELKHYRELVSRVEMYRMALNEIEVQELLARSNQYGSALQESEKELVEMQESLDEVVERISLLQTQQSEAEEEITTYRDHINDLKKTLDELLRQESEAELSRDEASTRLQKNQREKQRKAEQLSGLKATLTQLKHQAEVEWQHELDTKRALQNEVEREQGQLAGKLQMLQDKKERCMKYKTFASRKAHLEKEIQQHQADATHVTQALQDLRNEQVTVQQNLSQMRQSDADERFRELEGQMSQIKQALNVNGRRRMEAKQLEADIRSTLAQTSRSSLNRRKALKQIDGLRSFVKDRTWRGILSVMYWDLTAEHGGAFQADNVDVFKTVLQLSSFLRAHNPQVDATRWRRGLQVDGLRIPGVLGPLWTLFDVESIYSTAVTTALNTQLDNVVCMDDALSSAIVEDLKSRRSDETVSLTPLNQITMQWGSTRMTYPEGVYIPQENEAFDLHRVQCVPLSSVIKVPNFLRPVVTQVARKWLLISDSNYAQQFTNAGFDCVTLDGDKLFSKGSLQGGHIAQQDILKTVNDIRATLIGREGDAAGLAAQQQQLRELADQISAFDTEREQLDGEHQRIKDEVVMLRSQHHSLAVARTNLETRRSRLESEIELHERKLQWYAETIASHKKILVAKEDESVTDADISEIEALDAALRVTEAQVAETRQAVTTLKRKIENAAAEAARIEETIVALEAENDQNDAFSDSMSSRLHESHIESLKERRLKVEQEKRQHEQQLRQLISARDVAKREEDELKNTHARGMKRFQMLSAKSETLIQKDAELKHRLKLHQENKAQALAKCNQDESTIQQLREQFSQHELQEQVKQAEKNLGTCPRVNEKAIEDLAQYKAEFDEKRREQEGLAKSLESVKELMTVLDNRRSQTLRMSFDLVNTNLQQVFAALVPGGKAKLVIKKLSDSQIAELQESMDESQYSQYSMSGSTQDAAHRVRWNDHRPLPRVPQWDDVAQGIEIKASFRPTDSDHEPVNFFPIIALSGGQKTVLALSLIFAMQRCDKAPFYIFDECDAALDEGYRSAIAQLIAASTANSQFLITTFRKELCEICDKHFMVTSEDRVASIRPCTRQEAVEKVLAEQGIQDDQQLSLLDQ